MHDRRILVALAIAIGLAIPITFLSGSAANPPKLVVEHFMVDAVDPGIKLYVRNKRPENLKKFTSGKTLLFVHGATPAIDGILEEAEEVSGEVEDKAVLDAALIASAQAVEHYEITRYGSLVAWAKRLGRPDCASVLQENLDEEKATDQKLTELAESGINQKAA